MKKKFFLSFLKNIIVPGLILALSVYFLRYTLLSEYIHPMALWLIALFTLFSMLTLYLNLRAINGPGENSVSRMIFVNVFRILLTFGMVAAFIISGVNDRGLFIFNFLTLYLFFLVFEINAVISKLRRNLNRGD